MSLTIQNLKKDYIGPDGSRVQVIDVPHLHVGTGEQAALIGSSGSGKTTLLHLIAGILIPDDGSIVFNFGDDSSPHAAAPAPVQQNTVNYQHASVSDNEKVIDISRLSEGQRDVFRGRHIGYVFQTHHLLPGFTALENVLLGMSFTGRKADHAWATRLLDEVGLADRAHYKPAKLSVGQQQRVAVARALANRPSLVLADEPTGALDPQNAQQSLDLMRKLCAEVNSSLLLVSHDLGIANQLPRVLTLADVNRAAMQPAGIAPQSAAASTPSLIGH